MSSIIEGPLGLSINQLETIHALVGLRDGKRKREKTSKPTNTIAVNPSRTLVQLREPTRSAQGSPSDEVTTESSTSDDFFCFIYPDDIECLTSYLLLLFAQVKKDVMNDDDRAKKANRSTSLLNYGFRCRHCGGHERVNRLRQDCFVFLKFALAQPICFTQSREATSPRRKRIFRLAQRRSTPT